LATGAGRLLVCIRRCKHTVWALFGCCSVQFRTASLALSHTCVSAGANNTILTAPLSSTCKGYTLQNAIASPATYAGCLDGDKGTQGTLVVGGQQAVAQIATAAAMAAACTAAGGCDFIMNTGDNFYDLGITGGATDPQWSAYTNVYTTALFPNTPFLGAPAAALAPRARIGLRQWPAP